MPHVSERVAHVGYMYQGSRNGTVVEHHMCLRVCVVCLGAQGCVNRKGKEGYVCVEYTPFMKLLVYIGCLLVVV